MARNKFHERLLKVEEAKLTSEQKMILQILALLEEYNPDATFDSLFKEYTKDL